MKKQIYVFDSYVDNITRQEALKHWGAIPGIVFGPMGHCFALPTTSLGSLMFLPSVFEFYVQQFGAYAATNRNLEFIISPMCGRFTLDILIRQIIPVFKRNCGLNCVLPDEWKQLL